MTHPAWKLYIPILLIVLFIAGCTPAPNNPTTVTEPPVTIPVTAEVPTEPAIQTPTEEAPLHSELYIPDISVEDVILYFNEVCMDAEFINSGDPSRLQKWISPITYYIQGSPTAEDLETLNGFAAWLNTIEGFPGICQTQEPAEANLKIHFCSQDELINLMGNGFHGTDGAVTFWYMDDIIYDAIICYRTDLDQHLRNSVILEELYNGLGPIQDTALRPDSIIYSEFSEPQKLTPMDELILRLLYHPDIRCGMDTAACEEVIRNLYY